MNADITEAGRSQQCIAYGMDQHIGIGVADGSFLVLEPDAAQPQGIPLAKAVNIKAEAYAYLQV